MLTPSTFEIYCLGNCFHEENLTGIFFYWDIFTATVEPAPSIYIWNKVVAF